MDEIFCTVVDLVLLFSEFQRIREELVGVCEGSGFYFFFLGVLFPGLGEALSSDHFVEEAIVGFEVLVEVLEVGLIGEVDSADEGDFDLFFLVSYRSGLKEDLILGAMNADEIARLIRGVRDLFGSCQQRKRSKEVSGDFHETRLP